MNWLNDTVYRSPTQRMVFMALLTALAVTLNGVERMIPLPVALPGVKLGLANTITLAALYLLSLPDVGIIVLMRVFLGSLLLGSFSSFMFSLSGAVLAFAVMGWLKSRFSEVFSIVGISVAGAVAHNMGQLLVAAVVVQNLKVLSYLPFLLVAAVGTGVGIGFTVQAVLRPLKAAIRHKR